MPSEGMVREKVVSYLAGLTPDARAMLLRRLEVSERGNRLDPDTRLILEVARNAGVAAEGAGSGGLAGGGPRKVDLRASFFQPFERYLIDEDLKNRQPGWIRRSSLDGLWLHLTRDIMPAEFGPLMILQDLPDDRSVVQYEKDVADLRNRALDTLAHLHRASDPDSKEHRRLVAHIGGEDAYADACDLLVLRERLPVIGRLLARIPASVVPGEASEKILAEQVAAFVEARPDEVIWMSPAILDRMPNPFVLARVAAAVAGSGDAVEIRRAGVGPMVDLALASAERCEIRLRALMQRRAEVEVILAELRTVHDLIRGVTSAIQIEDDRDWHTRLAAVRKSVSLLLGTQFDGVVQKIRLALRADDRHMPSEADRADARRAVFLFAAAKRYRGALAMNDLLTRLDPTVTQALELYGRDLIETYRKARGDQRTELAACGKVLVAMTEQIMGEDHAAVLRRAWDKAKKAVPVNPFA